MSGPTECSDDIGAGVIFGHLQDRHRNGERHRCRPGKLRPLSREPSPVELARREAVALAGNRNARSPEG
jgi:hypothetical protein